MYFGTHIIKNALEILAAAGYAAEAISASRPSGTTRYVLSVEAQHLPRLDGKVRTVTIRTPQELMGWGATQAEVDWLNRYDFAA
jgi:hypothetical protein